MLRTALGLLFASIAMAQPAFEVASVKPAEIPPGAPEHWQYHMTESGDASRVEYANASLVDLLRIAFRVNTYQISGPGWMANRKFDIVAKIPAGATREQAPEMVRQLLAERFGLETHHNTAEHSVLGLVPAKGGLKLRETPPDSDAPATGAFRRSVDADGAMQMQIRRMTTTALAELLGRFLGQAVVDVTGARGAYDFSLSFSPADLRRASQVAGVASPVPAEADGPESSIAASLEQFGLKLEGRKLPIDLLVIDHLEKAPTAN
jgi:uncharacterized protein (TIGR03435 family)